ncbi:MAG: DNA polymerase LigD [Streptosporangiales bacterium]|nr:DNA polymerase LigD [Streptosporangiales bacterium]
MSEPMPALIEPMMAVTGGLPTGPEADRWGLELKWDGVRAITYVDGAGGPGGATVRATGRRGSDITSRYPEVAGLAGLLEGHRAVFDGEVVAFDRHGRPSFEALQKRMHVADPAARGLTVEVPVTYVVFDLLYLDGISTLRVPYEQRRALLDDLELGAGSIQTSPCFREGGQQLLDATREQGLEGLIAKRLDSLYLPGRRVDFWRKVKNFLTQAVVIAGWKPGKGRRAGGIGSLLIGVYDERGLTYVGHVGTGFTDRMLDELAEMLRPLEIPHSPYVDEVPREYAKDAHWVAPRIVGEVGYTVWTEDNRLRTPSWRGLRPEIPPHEVFRE